MKIKALILAGVLGLSAQASHAATDTSCNPFLRGGCGASVSKAALNAAPHSMVGQLFASLGAQRSDSATASTKRSRSRGSFMSRFFQINRTVVVGPKVSDFEEKPIEVVGNGDDSQPGEGISVVPVPATGFLLLAGLGGLAMVRRKKS